MKPIFWSCFPLYWYCPLAKTLLNTPWLLQSSSASQLAFCSLARMPFLCSFNTQLGGPSPLWITNYTHCSCMFYSVKYFYIYYLWCSQEPSGKVSLTVHGRGRGLSKITWLVDQGRFRTTTLLPPDDTSHEASPLSSLGSWWGLWDNLRPKHTVTTKTGSGH